MSQGACTYVWVCEDTRGVRVLCTLVCVLMCLMLALSLLEPDFARKRLVNEGAQEGSSLLKLIAPVPETRESRKNFKYESLQWNLIKYKINIKQSFNY